MIWISVSAFVILLLVGVIIVIIVLRSRKRKKEEGEPSDDLRYSYPETDAIQGRSPGICADDLRETIDEGEGSEQALYEEDLCGHPAGVRGTTQEFNGGTSPEVTTGDICSLPPLSAETLLPPVAGEVTSVDDMVALPPSTLEEVDKGSNPSDVISAAKPPSGNTPRRKVVRKVVKKKTA